MTDSIKKFDYPKTQLADNTITAYKIYSRGLSMIDASGNILLTAGTGLKRNKNSKLIYIGTADFDAFEGFSSTSLRKFESLILWQDNYKESMFQYFSASGFTEEDAQFIVEGITPTCEVARDLFSSAKLIYKLGQFQLYSDLLQKTRDILSSTKISLIGIPYFLRRQNELIKDCIENLSRTGISFGSVLPSPGSVGDLFFNTTNSVLYEHDDFGWVPAKN